MSNPSNTTTRPWSPSGDDHLIYEWVKMQGKTQADVACLLRLHQSTISRVIQRYERWQAHAKARENGDLDHAERLRAQHRLTFERNELILSSCLRIAREIEGFTDVSKSTVSRPYSRPSEERELRTQHATIDRTGTVARFLRLAYRINMDQLKLAALDEPPPAQSLSDAELAEHASLAANDAALISAALGRKSPTDPTWEGEAPTEPVGWALPTEPTESELNAGTDVSPVLAADSTSQVQPTNTPLRTPNPPPSTSYSEPSKAPGASILNPEPRTLNPPPNPLHNLHTENPPQIAATQSLPCTCAAHSNPEKNVTACIIDDQPPAWLEDGRHHTSEAKGVHSPAYDRCAVPFAPAV